MASRPRKEFQPGWVRPPVRLRKGAGKSALKKGVTAVRGGSRWVVRKKNELGWKRFLLRAAGMGASAMFLYLFILWLGLPNIQDPQALIATQSTVITDRDGIELYRPGDTDRTVIETEKIPEIMRQAIVAIEDERFYQHGCIDTKGVVRAVLSQFLPFLQRSGGSTITQQLARNSVITSERTLTRKLREMMLACEIERVYDKDEVLGLYLNWVPFGPTVYGVEQASRQYFGKSVEQISLAEAAVLASLPQRPSYLNPYGPNVRTSLTESGRARLTSGRVETREDLRDADIKLGLLGNTFGSGANAIYVGGRSDQVLQNMEDQGFITDDQRLEALGKLSALAFQPARESIQAPHFTLWVKSRLEKQFQTAGDERLLEDGGLTIRTTLSWPLQKIAEEVVKKRAPETLERYGAHNIALVALNPRTREILAYVGNTDYRDTEHGGKIDMARVPRQPGSTFKPLVYAAAFENGGYGPATILYDVPTKFGGNSPQNFDGGFWGLTNARRALGGSRNIPAIKAFYLAGGEDRVLRFVEKLGARTPRTQVQSGRVKDYGYTLAIGAGETPLLEMAEAYATLADGGIHKPPVSILQITDRNKALRFKADLEKAGEEELDPRIAYQITSILSDTAARPGGFWQAALDVPGTVEAAKTGTSNKCEETDARGVNCIKRKPLDLWTMGYTPDLVVGVWVGNADSSSLPDRAESLSVAAPIWREFLTRAYREKAVTPTRDGFPVPSGIVQPQVSLLSGELPTDCTPVEMRRSDVFLKEHAPTLQDPACVQLEVDRVTGLLASDSCPAEARETRSFLKPASGNFTGLSAQLRADWEAGVQAWAKGLKSGTGGLLPIAPTEQCDISKTPGRLTQPRLTVRFPVDGGTATYPAFTPEVDVSSGTGVLSVTYALDGRELLTVTRAPWAEPLRIPRSISESGRHTLKVTVTDRYYNQASEELNITFEEDDASPQVTFLTPADGTGFRRSGSLRMQARATDDSGIKYVELYLDATLVARPLAPPFEATYALSGLDPGPHRLRAVATDFSGNTAEETIEITVEE